MVQLNNLRNFNSKCENESLLVIPLPCGVPDGLVTCGCSVIANTHTQCKQIAVKVVLSRFEIISKISNVCFIKSTKFIALKL